MKARVTASALPAVIVALLVYCVGCSDDSQRPGLQSNVPLLIEPNLSVGKIRAGMHTEQIIALLGQPQRRTANSIEYTSMGFAVMPGPEGVVQVVMCGDVTGINGPLVKAFSGRTKEGIGLNSSREDLIKAYGEPTSSEKMRGGLESLRYDPLDITFTLEAGKVYHMIIRLRGPPEPDRSVTLEPPPASAQK